MPTQEQLWDIIEYAKRVKNIAKEAGRVAEFAVMLQKVFGDIHEDVSDFSASMERAVTLKKGNTIVRRGRLDAMLGSVILEFKTDIKKGEKVGKSELKKYAVSLTQLFDESEIPYNGILTDGWRFQAFGILLEEGKDLATENVELEKSAYIELKPNRESANSFYWFLHRWLLQETLRDPTAESFERDFGPTGPIFFKTMAALRSAWGLVKEESDVKLALRQWAKFLQFSYGTDIAKGKSAETLFLKHTYLCSIAKFMVWAAFWADDNGIDDADLIRGILSGDELEKRNIVGVSDRDAFHWILKPGVAEEVLVTWSRLLSELRSYRLKDIKTDILKVLYERLVDPEDRHDLGEYYTPNWLCRNVIDELLPEESFEFAVPRLLDPTCGSGSFLVAAIDRYRRELAEQAIPKKKRGREISENIIGFDINPLATIIARANYILALGEDFDVSDQDVAVPVYLADSMMTQKDKVIQSVIGKDSFAITIGDPPLEQVEIPTLVKHPPMAYDAFVDCSRMFAEKDLEGEVLSEMAIRGRFLRYVGEKIRCEGPKWDDVVAAVRKLGAQMAELQRKGEDTIWAFIARNFYRPYIYEKECRVVVGNPPWLTFKDIKSKEYKKHLERLGVDRYRVCSKKSSLRTQTELATTFFLHAARSYLPDKVGRIAMVLPRSPFSADQHAEFRAGPSSPSVGTFSIREIWDLADVSPLFRVPSCVIFGENRKSGKKKSDWDGRIFRGRFGEQEASQADVQQKLSQRKTTFVVSRLAGRSAWTEEDKRVYFDKPSWYADKFYQGATIVPRNMFFVRVHGEIPKSPNRTIHVETEPEQAKAAKKPWKDLHFSGPIERRYLYKSALAKHLLPFTMESELPDVVLPIQIEGGKATMLSAKDVENKGDFEGAKYFGACEKAYLEHRKGAGSKQTDDLCKQLDYMSKLTQQNLTAKYVVTYAAAGTHVCASVVKATTLPSAYVTEHKLYRFEAASLAESHYLVALLNSPTINELVKPFQSRGLMGERDIEKKVLDLPIPKYNSKDELHKQLADLGGECAKIAKASLSKLTEKTLGRRRSEMRVILKDQLEQIDVLVKELLGVE